MSRADIGTTTRARGATDVAKVRLDVLGERREISLSVPIDACALVDMLPAARELSRTVAEVAIASAEAAGHEVTCRRGCAACCRQLVPISVVEAVALVEQVATMPAEAQAGVRARFAEAVQRMEEGGLLDAEAPKGTRPLRSTKEGQSEAWSDVSRRYFDMVIDCPLLVDQSCSIYSHRPLVCAEYHVTTPAAWCEELDERARTIEWPLRMSEVMAELAEEVAGARPSMIPLAMALEWYDAHAGSLAECHTGEKLFWRLMEHIASHDTAAGDAEGASERDEH